MLYNDTRNKIHSLEMEFYSIYTKSDRQKLVRCFEYVFCHMSRVWDNFYILLLWKRDLEDYCTIVDS